MFQWLHVVKVVLCISQVQAFLYNSRVAIFPSSDTFLTVGSNLTIYCLYVDKQTPLEPNESLYLTDDNNVPFSSTPVNGSAIKIMVQNATFGDWKYFCKMNSSTEDFLRQTKILEVRVGYLPPAPTEVTFFSEDFKNLVCSFKMTKERNKEISYWVLNFTIMNLGKDTNCFNGFCSGDPFLCKCPISGDRCVMGVCFFNDVNYYFKLVGGNYFGKYYQDFNVTTDLSIVKLTGLKNLVISPSSRKLDLTLNFPDGQVTFNLVELRLLYKSQWDATWNTKNVTTNYSNVMITLEDLTPYANYEVNLDYKLVESKFWSDVMNRSSKTLSSAPDKGPLLAPIAYMDCGGPTYCLVIYWKPVPARYQNGKILFYQITITQTKNSSHRPSLSVVDGDSLNTVVRNLSLEHSYKFEITASTKNGSSPPSLFFIPERSKVLRKPIGVTAEKMANDSFLVSWQLSENSKAVNVIVFWCLRNSGVSDEIVLCKDYIDWIVLPADTKEHFVSLGRKYYKEIHSLVFGVSSFASNRSSGLEFSTCNYNYNGIVSKPGQPILSPTKGENGFNLKWPPYRSCRDTGGRPLVYQLLYATGLESCKIGKVKNVTSVGGLPKEKEVVVINLEPFSWYTVCVCIITRAGESLVGDPASVRTREVPPSTCPRNLTAGNITASIVWLTWLPPAEPNGNITHYTVKTLAPKNDSLTVLDTSAVLDHLLKFTIYNWTVLACNSAGCSLCSSMICVQTKMAAPSAVARMSVRVKNRSHILVTWEKPKEPNGRIVYYQLTVALNGSVVVQNVSSAANSSPVKIFCSSTELQVANVSVQAVTSDATESYFGDALSQTVNVCLPAGLISVTNTDYKIIISVNGMVLVLFGVGLFVFLWRKKCLKFQIQFPNEDLNFPSYDEVKSPKYEEIFQQQKCMNSVGDQQVYSTPSCSEVDNFSLISNTSSKSPDSQKRLSKKCAISRCSEFYDNPQDADLMSAETGSVKIQSEQRMPLEVQYSCDCHQKASSISSYIFYHFNDPENLETAERMRETQTGDADGVFLTQQNDASSPFSDYKPISSCCLHHGSEETVL